MNVPELLQKLKDNKIDIDLSGNDIKINYDREEILDIFYDEIRKNKSAIVNFLMRTAAGAEGEIRTIQRPDKIPLSFGQERLWFIHQLEGSVQYHIPLLFRLGGDIDQGILNRALKQIINRHEVLRTVYYQEEENVYQRIMKSDNWTLNVINEKACIKQLADASGLIRELLSRPFNLSEDYMLRADLISLQEECVLVIVMHHIASDGFSVHVVENELWALSSLYSKSHGPALPPLPFQYADFAVWQRNAWNDMPAAKLAYWQKKLENTASLSLPTDHPRPAVQSTRGGRFRFHIDGELTRKIANISRDEGATLFMTLLAAFNVLLYRCTNDQDICIGSPISGRQHLEVEQMIGFFVNTLVLRTEVSGNLSFLELLQRVKTTTLEAYEHQEVPFEKIVEAVVRRRDTSRPPLFQVMMVLHNYAAGPDRQPEPGNTTAVRIPSNHMTTICDINIAIGASPDGLNGLFEYCADLYEEETIARMARHFENLLEAIAEDPGKPIAQIRMLDREEEDWLLAQAGNTKACSTDDKTIVGLFEEQAAEVPDKIAVVYGEEKLTYRELDEWSSRIGHYLRSRGVEENMPVPVCIERSLKLVAGILGILKAGGAYVPLDPEYPLDRVSYMIMDTGAPVVLTSSRCRGIIEENKGICIVSVDQDAEQIGRQPAWPVVCRVDPDRLGYVIYTSGSTGRPKGVAMPERGLVNLLRWHGEDIVKGGGKRVLQFASINFDASFHEIFTAICFGGSVHLIDEQERKDAGAMLKIIGEQAIQHLFIPYVVLKNLSEQAQDEGLYPESLEGIFCGGEQLRLSDDIRELVERTGCRLINYYGPSETHGVTTYEIRDTDFVQRILPPIGRPMANTYVYILGREMELVPQGVVGEIYIGGRQVAHGYWNREELTKERFIKDPFTNKSGAVVYRTGDLGRWLSDGNIEYIGRIDDQVKIRGNRVELGEVESVLGECAGIRQCVVVAKEDKRGYKQLVGYVVAEGGLDREEVMGALRERLPDYMIPSVLVEMQRLPLTENGKVAKRQLPDVGEEELLGRGYVEPRTELEKTLVKIWEGVLGVTGIGTGDNFFEIGGHSLLVTRVISAIRRQLSREVAIRDMFLCPTVGLLAGLIKKGEGGVMLPPVEAYERPERIPLSYEQERLWFIDRFEGSLSYHIPWVVEVTGKFDIEALEYAFQEIVNRHEILRTVIREEGGEGFQVIHPPGTWKMDVVTEADILAEGYSISNYIRLHVIRPFNLAQDSMIRVLVIQVSEERHWVATVFHHIAFDGWSMEIVRKELTELYESRKNNRILILKELPVQYADYALWQRRHLSGGAIEKKIEYWRNALDQVMPMEWPDCIQGEGEPEPDAAIIRLTLGKEIRDQLTAFSLQENATVFMVLLSVFKVALYRYCGQEDICVGTPVAGRMDQQIEDVVGFFINMLALRSRLHGHMSFTELLKEVKKTTLDALDHQDIPFTKIVEALNVERRLDISPLFQVTFKFQNAVPPDTLNYGGIQMTNVVPDGLVSKYDMTLNVTDAETGLYLSLTYRRDKFGEVSMKRFLDHYSCLLASCLKDRSVRIGVVPMLTLLELRQLRDWGSSSVVYEEAPSVLTLFERQVELHPASTALVWRDECFSYDWVNKQADRVACRLQGLGVKKGDLIPFFTERGPWMITGLLGIMKAGAVYVPFDGRQPQDRLRYLWEDLSARYVLVGGGNSELKRSIKEGMVLLSMQDLEAGDLKEPAEKVQAERLSSDAVYVIYTSGSTGRPKGVMITQKNLIDYLYGLWSRTDIRECGSFALLSPLWTDLGNTILYAALTGGGELHILDEDLVNNGRQLNRYLSDKEVECLKIVPSHWRALSSYGEPVRPKKLLIFGGERLYNADIQQIADMDLKVFNHYGPTETTIGKLLYEVTPGCSNQRHKTAIQLGRPFGNAQVYILGPEGTVCPIGIKGELHIGGAGLGEGYLNSSSITADKFIHGLDPAKPDNRLYRTGDLACWLEDGNICFLGRSDDEIKVRGYRVHPQEIDRAVRRYPGVKDCLILGREKDECEVEMVAYVQGTEDMDREGLKKFLSNLLPEYMMPAYVVYIDRWPLTANGKVDRLLLPHPQEESRERIRSRVLPGTETEHLLVDIWEEVLKKGPVGVNDNFFELGGHSLLIIRLVATVQTRMGIDLPIREIFQRPTIAELAEYVENIQVPEVNITIEAI